MNKKIPQTYMNKKTSQTRLKDYWELRRRKLKGEFVDDREWAAAIAAIDINRKSPHPTLAQVFRIYGE